MVLLLVFAPANPPAGETPYWSDVFDGANAAEAAGKMKVYSILKSEMKDLDESAVWEITGAVLKESERHRFDPMLVLAMIALESRFERDAVSAKGARGLMQIRPFVAEALAGKAGIDGWGGEETLHDPATNIKIGVYYLGELRSRFQDLKLALTAYNVGPTEIANRLRAKTAIPERYVKKVLSIYDVYRARANGKPEAQGTERL